MENSLENLNREKLDEAKYQEISLRTHYEQRVKFIIIAKGYFLGVC